MDDAKTKYLDDLIEDVATGVLQVLTYFRTTTVEQRGEAGWNGIMAAAYEGRSEAAEEWIFEFIKDGITLHNIQLSGEVEDPLEWAKRFTRPYLEKFCRCLYIERNPDYDHMDLPCVIHKEETVVDHP